MPFGDTPQSKFFQPSHGRYAVRFLGIRDGKEQTYPDGKKGIPAIWSLALYNQDGTPVLDPNNPEQVPAVAEVMSGQSVGFGKDGQPAKGRLWLDPFYRGVTNGAPLPDELSPEQTLAIVAQLQSVGAWAWFTFGPNTNKTSKTTTVVREVAPMIPQPAPSPVPQIVARAAAQAVPPTTPASFAPAPAAPVFAAPAAPAVAEAPAAPVFGAAPAAPVFPAPAAAAPAPLAAPVDAIPPMVFPTA